MKKNTIDKKELAEAISKKDLILKTKKIVTK